MEMHYPNMELPPMVKCMCEQAGLKLRTNHSLSNWRHSSLYRCGKKNKTLIRKVKGTVMLSVFPLKKTSKQQKQLIYILIVEFEMKISSGILGFEIFRTLSSTSLFKSSKT